MMTDRQITNYQSMLSGHGVSLSGSLSWRIFNCDSTSMGVDAPSQQPSLLSSSYNHLPQYASLASFVLHLLNLPGHGLFE